MRFESMCMEYGQRLEWESISGSEHSAEEEMSTSLSDMVNSFIEKDFESDQWQQPHNHIDDDDANDQHEDESQINEAKLVETELKKLINNDTKKASLLSEVENATKQSVLDDSRSISCRELMTRLRAKGLDAGVCKSKWQKHGSIHGGDHEYVDIIINTIDHINTRYIVELNLIELFTIARPTVHYATLLKTVPEVYVGTVEEMKQVVKLMCKAMKVSMGCMDMKVPPWRKYEYMKAKWLGCYKRSTKSCTSTAESFVARNSYCNQNSIRDRSVGFEVVKVKNDLSVYSVMQYPCRDEVGERTRMEHGQLAAVFRARQQPEF